MDFSPDFPTLMLGVILWFCATMTVGILLDLPFMYQSRRWLVRPSMKLLALLIGLLPAPVAMGHLHEKLLSTFGYGFWKFDMLGFWVSAPLLTGLAGSWLALPPSRNPRANASSAIGISLLLWAVNVCLVAWR